MQSHIRRNAVTNFKLMKVNEVAWSNLKKQIEMHLKEDPNYGQTLNCCGTSNWLNTNFCEQCKLLKLKCFN